MSNVGSVTAYPRVVFVNICRETEREIEGEGERVSEREERSETV